MKHATLSSKPLKATGAIRTALSARRALVTVCHPVWTLDGGGLERQLVQATAALSPDRFRHVIVTRESEAVRCEECELSEGTRLVRLPGGGPDPHWASKLSEVLRSHEVDVLHVRGQSMLLDATFACELAGGTPLAMSFHGFEAYPPRWSSLRRGMLRTAIRRCSDRWAVSQNAAVAIASELGMNPVEFGVVPNGVDTSRFCPARCRRTVRNSLRLPDDRPILMTIASLKPIKGHAQLLKALANVRGRGLGFHAVFAGRDYLDGALQRLAKELGLGEHVHFVGEQSDTLPWHQSADLFVLPSLWEGMSNALLEALACGAACISSDVGGNRDLITDGENGRLIRGGRDDSLADAISDLLIDHAARVHLGSAARERVCHNHTIDKTLGQLAERYLTLAGVHDGESA